MTSAAGTGGRFIVLEGLDGAGTTTQAAAIAAALRAGGRSVRVTRQPSDGPIGTLIRQALTRRLGLPGGQGPLTPDTLALLFAADRLDHLAAEVRPSLERGEWIICDRYLLSSLAYQGSELPVAFVEAINQRARVPDLTLFLEVTPDLAGQRRSSRGGDAELFDAEEKQRRIAGEYRAAIERRKGDERIVTLDGSRPVAEVTRAALEEIARLPA